MIITLCGSARFEEQFHEWNKLLTFSGHTVFSLTSYPSIQGGKDWYTPDQKRFLDLAHFRKILLSEGIVVLNKDRYVGESTSNEINWARMLGKEIYWLEAWEGTGVDATQLLT